MENAITTEMNPTKTRGFWLSAFLILMLLANAATAFTYFSNPTLIVDLYPKVTTSFVYSLGLMAVINFLFAVLIWCWKKIGVYGFYLNALIAVGINIYLGVNIGTVLFALVGPALLYFLTRSRWASFT